MKHAKSGTIRKLVWRLLPLAALALVVICAGLAHAQGDDGSSGVDKRDKMGRTPLMLASKRGNIDKMKQLISAGADVNARNKKGHPPLLYAANKGRTEAVRLLLENGADVNAQSDLGTTALYYAAENGWPDMAAVLFEYGADPDLKKKDGWGPLGVAKYYKHYDVAALIQRNSPVHEMPAANDVARDKAGIGGGGRREVEYADKVTDLMRAAEYGRVIEVKYLLVTGADVNAQDHDGNTALIYAVRGGFGFTAVMLINGGADVNAEDFSGHTALYYAEKKGYDKIVGLLIEEGAVSRR